MLVVFFYAQDVGVARVSVVSRFNFVVQVFPRERGGFGSFGSPHGSPQVDHFQSENDDHATQK